MEVLQLSLVVVVVIGLILGMVAILAFSRRLKTSSRATQSMTVVMAVVTGLVVLFSVFIWFLKR